MAIEWKRVDVALFSEPVRAPGNLHAVIEAKRLDRSCFTARSQATRYAEDKPGCNRLIVTDGIRYGIYLRDRGDGEFREPPYAYLNLSKLRTEYPIFQCHGAVEALHAMTPGWSRMEA